MHHCRNHITQGTDNIQYRRIIGNLNDIALYSKATTEEIFIQFEIVNSFRNLINRGIWLLIMLKQILNQFDSLDDSRILIDSSNITLGFRNSTEIDIQILIYNRIVQFLSQSQNHIRLVCLINCAERIASLTIVHVHVLTEDSSINITHCAYPPYRDFARRLITFLYAPFPSSRSR